MKAIMRTKFRLVSVARAVGMVMDQATGAYAPGEVSTLKFTAVVGSTPENKAFFAATPCGEVSLGAVRKEVADQFVLGGEYTLDFLTAGV
jgi:hypothetical protein